ncbi:hypothetical protein [uncultured Piscinibacter sp.]|uniref:hypothetical protein n=1 Tax=uncultured Piscinibacter sp. TaxID=1131835 RepID=UPI00261CDC4C|nr:hypothetical protein [uncultured Piscinibacter sp.]
MKVFGIADAKFYPLISAGDRCAGGVEDPVYDDGVDIGCVQELTWDRELVEAELNGDDGTCARVSRPKAITFSIKHGGLDPALIATLQGATQTDFTVGDVNGTRTKVTCTDPRPRGAIIAQSINHDMTEDMHIVIWNAEVLNGPGGSLANEAFYESTFEGKADRSLYEGCCDWFDILEHDALVDIPTVFPGTDDY